MSGNAVMAFPLDVLVFWRCSLSEGMMRGLGCAVVAMLGGTAMAQCPSNGGNYVTTVSNGAVVPGDTDTGNHGDDAATPIALPFAWSFYGTSYTQAYVCSNGWMGFDGGSGTGYSNSCLPQTLTTAAYNCVTGPAILPYLDDLRTDIGSSGILTSVSGSAPNRIFNIEWRAVYYANNTVPCNFEGGLYENRNRLRV